MSLPLDVMGHAKQNFFPSFRSSIDSSIPCFFLSCLLYSFFLVQWCNARSHYSFDGAQRPVKFGASCFGPQPTFVATFWPGKEQESRGMGCPTLFYILHSGVQDSYGIAAMNKGQTAKQ